MRNIVKALVMAGLGPALAAGSAEAQQAGQQPAGQQQAESETATAESIMLVYDREVYVYNGDNRRDPFRPLSSATDMGPRFEMLSLQGIIYATGQGRSVALLGDATGRIHRVRSGDVVGNSRVIEIGPTRVVLAVENFGTIRQEILELPRRGGSDQ